MKKFTRARALVFGALVAAIVVGVVAPVATGTWSALGVESIVALCPVGALEVLLGARQFLWHPLVLLVAVLVAVVLVGKAFCAWACPVPWIDRFFHPRKKAEKEGAGNAEAAGVSGSAEADGTEVIAVDSPARPASISPTAPAPEFAPASTCGTKPHCAGCALAPVGGKRDGFQLDTRHFALLGALGSAALFGFPVFCLVCPIGLTAALIAGVVHLFGAGETSWGLLLFPAILLLEVVFFRKWCTRICPVSALLSLVSNANRTFKPTVNAEACLRTQGIDCHVCVEACPEQLDPHTRSIPECSKCGACVESCPAQAITIKALPK